jgi:aspartate racemase
MQSVALFGTKSTMTNGFYNNVAKQYGINIVIPDKEKQDYIHTKYMTELVLTRSYLNQTINSDYKRIKRKDL